VVPRRCERLDTLRPGWWAGFLGYDLGRAVERVTPRAHDDLGLPDLLLARYDARIVIGPGAPDARERSAPGTGSRRSWSRLRSPSRGRCSVRPPPRWTVRRSRPAFAASWSSSPPATATQANLTRRISWEGEPDPRWLFARLSTRNPAPHASLVVLPRRDASPIAVVSASPEQFLRWRGRAIETRPIKGTARDAAWLRASAKDRAENVMIVDLARNDLGRVCVPGSITVPTLCGLEAHPGLHHLVSVVRGRTRDDVGVGDLIRATFRPHRSPAPPSPASCRSSRTSSPSDAASTAGRWGGSTPAPARALSPWRSARSR